MNETPRPAADLLAVLLTEEAAVIGAFYVAASAVLVIVALWIAEAVRVRGARQALPDQDLPPIDSREARLRRDQDAARRTH